MPASASHIVVLFIADLGMMAFLAILFGETKRYALNETFREVALGAMFGICAIYSIVSHKTFGGPGSLDAATIFVAFSGAFLSLLGGAVTLLLAIGASMATETPFRWNQHLDVGIAIAMGIAWRRTQNQEEAADIRSILLLGGLICLTFVPFGTLLAGQAEPGWAARTLPAAAMAFLATGILGGFIERERRLISVELLLRKDAHTDELTGLANRRTFERAFLAQSRTAPDGLHALIVADVDHFKAINDTFGHAVGDLVLRSIADLLRRLVRSNDLVARMGGEEFAILLHAHSPEEALAAAERIREQISATPVLAGALSVNITISMGLCCWTESAEFREVFERADTALYDAKRSGRNRAVLAPETTVAST